MRMTSCKRSLTLMYCASYNGVFLNLVIGPVDNRVKAITHTRGALAPRMWELWCAGFRHSAGLHVRVTLHGVTGDVRDVLGVLGVW